MWRAFRLQLLTGYRRGPTRLFQDLRRLPRPNEGTAQDPLDLGHEPQDSPSGAPEALLALRRQRSFCVVRPAFSVAFVRHRVTYDVEVQAPLLPLLALGFRPRFLHRLLEPLPRLALRQDAV